jgi:pimeloyl-ACP methyl ester carboxylesterase
LEADVIESTRVHLDALSGSTRVLTSGSGTPVLLLHGSPDCADEWRPVMEALGDDFACYAPDLPGLGEGDAPGDGYDYSRAANNAFLDELVGRLGINEPPILVVHDIGGVYGVPWAASRLGHIRGLVITNTVVFENFEWFPLAKIWSGRGTARRALAGVVMRQIGWFGGAVFRRLFARISPELGQTDLDRITRSFALDSKSKSATLRLFRQMVPASYFDGSETMLRSLILTAPVRVVWGTTDPYIPQRYAATFAPAPTEVIEGAGHWVPLSAPDNVARAVADVEGSLATAIPA